MNDWSGGYTISQYACHISHHSRAYHAKKIVFLKSLTLLIGPETNTELDNNRIQGHDFLSFFLHLVDSKGRE